MTTAPAQPERHHVRLLTILRAAYATLGAALVCVAAVPTSALTGFFEHAGRTHLNNGAVLETTRQGAQLVRVLAPVAGVALAALALWGDRLFRGAHQRPAPGHASKADWRVLGAAFALALALRLPLMTQSLWYDEIAAFMGYGAEGPGAAMGNYYTQANHILQTVLSWVSVTLFGVDEVTLRLPSFVVGLFGIVAAWWLGREAGGAAVGRGAAVAMALMPVAALEATEARGYAFMAYYATLATATWIWARRVRSGAGWAEYAVVCALGGWSHLVTLCVPVFHGLWNAWALWRARTPEERRDCAGGFLGLVVGALLTLALYAPALPDMAAIASEFRVREGNEPTLWSAQGLMMLEMLGGTWTWWASVAALPLLVAGAAAVRSNRSLALGVVLAGGGALVAILAPVAFNSWLYARFLTFVVPAVALVAGAGAAWLLARHRAAGVAAVALAACAWIASVVTLPPRQPLREGVAYIAQQRAPGDRALAIGLPDDVHRWYLPPDLEMPSAGPYGRHLPEALAAVHPQWILMLYPRAMPVKVHEQLRQAGYQRVLELPGWIDLGDGRVVVLRAPQQP